MKNKTVYIGLSGGVDSAVSAALLKDAGYNVIACFIKTWSPPGYPCPQEEDKLESMRVAAHLRLPWIEIDAVDAYKNNVANYLLNEYKAGRTPNGDVFCNTTVKFGTFYDLAMKRGADFVATGHYAQTSPGLSATLSLPSRGAGDEVLYKAIDPSKDQTYFLWNVPKEKLAKTIFPIGNITKTKVRDLAKKYKLPNAERPDSQGVCFLGPIDMKAYLKDMLKPEKGTVLDMDGNVIGQHDGAILYTMGERHGFQINKSKGEAYFVVGKNVEDNTLTVSTKKEDTKVKDNIVVTEINDLSSGNLFDRKIKAVFRYRGEEYDVILKKDGELEFLNQKPVASEGQSVVFYDGNVCLGGGIINYK